MPEQWLYLKKIKTDDLDPAQNLRMTYIQQTNNKIKGILFDVDGTLYHQSSLRLMMATLLISAHIMNPVLLVKTLKVIKSFRYAQEQIRQDSPFVSNCKRLQFDLAKHLANEPMEFVQKIVDKWFFRKPLPLLAYNKKSGLHSALRELSNKNIDLGVFSDYPAAGKLQALGVSQYFSFVISAWDNDIKGFKPQTNGFRVAAKRMGHHPEEILYVGDRESVDGVGARLAGMPYVILGKPDRLSSERILYAKNFDELIEIVYTRS